MLVGKRTFRPTFIRAWREFRDLTLQETADRVATICGEEDFSHATLSRIERGKIAYTQQRLEALAIALQCEPVDLLNRDPNDTSPLWEILEHLRHASRETQEQAARVVAALANTDN